MRGRSFRNTEMLHINLECVASEVVRGVFYAFLEIGQEILGHVSGRVFASKYLAHLRNQSVLTKLV